MVNPQGRGLNAAEAGMDNWQGIGNIEKSIGLFLGQNFLYPVVIFFSFLLVEGAPPFFDQLIHLFILV